MVRQMLWSFVAAFALSLFMAINVWAMMPEDATVVVFKKDSDTLVVDGASRQMDTTVFIDSHSRMMVPLSHLSFAFGVNPVMDAGWKWDPDSKTATIFDNDGTIIKATVGSKVLYVNDKPVQMDTEAVIKNDRIFLPVRFVGEALKFTFSWNDSSKEATASRNGAVAPNGPTPGGPQPTAAPTGPSQPSNFSSNKDGYSFANTNASFGYSRTYKIPKSVYTDVLGSKGAQYYNMEGPWGGSCYGFSATSLMFYLGSLNLKEYAPNAANLYSVPAPKSPTAAVTKLIEHFQVAQFLPNLQKSFTSNKNKYAQLVEAVRNFEKTSQNPPVLCVYGSHGGHAIVAYKVKDVSNGYQVICYDNNHPGQERIVTIGKDMNSFSYELMKGITYKSPAAWISYVPINDIAREASNKTMSSGTLIKSDKANVSVKNVGSVPVKDIPGAYEVYMFGPIADGAVQTQAVMYDVPDGEYLVQPSEISEIMIARDESLLQVKDLRQGNTLTNRASSDKLFEVSGSASKYTVAYSDASRGIGNIEMEVDSKGSFNASVDNGKLKLAGNAAVNITSGQEYADTSELSEASAASGYTAANNGYSFAGGRTEFGYPAGYKIPERTFIDALGPALAKTYINVCGEWKSSSFGMAATSMLFFTEDLPLSSYSVAAKKLADISSPDNRLTALIERLELMQYVPDFQKGMSSTEGQLKQIVDAVKAFEAGKADPILVCIYGPGGSRALVPYKVSGSGSAVNVVCYDSNYPGKERALSISGNYSSFSYEGFPASGICYVTKQSVKQYFGGAGDSAMDSHILISSTEASPDIRDKNNTGIASVPNAYQVHTFANVGGNEKPKTLFSSPDGEYTIAVKAASDVSVARGDEFVSAVGLRQGQTIKFDFANNKLLEVSGAASSFTVVYFSDSMDRVELKVTTGNEYFAIMSSGGRLTLSGRATVDVVSGDGYVDASGLE